MKIFAHRGYSHKYPEGTWIAYEKAVEAGADGFECDVRLSKDNQVVCFHDRNLKRIGNSKKAVRNLTAARLRDLVQAITLEELLDLSIETKRDLLIETKHPVFAGGEIEKRTLEIINRKANAIKQANIEITVMSFSYLAVRRMKKRYYNVMKVIKYPLAFLIRPTRNIAVDIELLKKHPGIMKRMKSGRIYVWTVNSEEDLKWLRKREIFGVITDRPKRARRILVSSHNG